MQDFSLEKGIVPEADIERLSKHIERYRENPEHSSLSGHEMVRRSLDVLTHPASETETGEPSASSLPAYLNVASEENKLEVEHLLSIAFSKGIDEAYGLARKSTPFVRDAFHDALAGRLYEEFKRRGILK